ncbi:hypothetical protein [Pontiella agarivorans]|uniref:Lipoprotein n=1 Tax=Pontiella agarivorans TaxID=3038953 RepID=A0ABU5MV69_9BACT|nr:hypothetical protein [Pontiella agarivorans]MDZ8118075.1 hypothetical protein [Pontiella agarivorans]
MQLKLKRLCLGMLAVSLACSAVGGFKEREQEIKERSKAKKAKDAGKKVYSDNDDIAHVAFGSGTYPTASNASSGGFMSDFWGWLVMAPFAYRNDDPLTSMNSEQNVWSDEPRSLFPHHEVGQATVPYVRFDYNFQWAEESDAHDGRVEVGYRFVALQARMTRYSDREGVSLDHRQYYGLLRYGGCRPDFLPGSFEANIGAGVATYGGDLEDTTSGAFTFGLKYYPVEWGGIEFRPAFYRWDEIFIRDYDLSASLGARYFQVRAGYRWIWDQGVVDLRSGFYTGFTLSY